MRLGLTMYVQNTPDWERFNALERGEDVPALDPNTDAALWSEEIETALRLEDQGFDTLWLVEHHVSPYTMITNPLQALAFFAGATTRIDVGTMVVVVPWHNPLRIAEDMTMLQHLLRGRDAYIGVGRGLGRREFKALGVDMNTSAERFSEGVEVIRLALSEEKFSYEGRHYQYENTTMRPRPRDGRRLLQNMCFAWGSPTSAPVGARHGLRPMIIPQRPFEQYLAELEAFNEAAVQAGHEVTRPRIHLHMYCHEDATVAEAAARQHIPEYVRSAMLNYELLGEHFKSLRGYEHYAGRLAGRSHDELSEAWVKNGVWGTPQMCLEKIEALCDIFHPEEFMLTGRYGCMRHDVSRKSIDLFAREVLPAVKEIRVQEPKHWQTAA
jgi:alkanesulfonate monooxygenase SsuD/methylene tetrahydromethanopterin reductase-like flavin-dependent oxidoreductase (luciferase family)